MKLRIDPSKICFRIDFDKLELLLTQGRLQETILLPETVINYKIIVLPAGSQADFSQNGGNFTLSLARDVIENHKKSLPSLAGIMTRFPIRNGEKITVSLEVNLKKKPKRG